MHNHVLIKLVSDYDEIFHNRKDYLLRGRFNMRFSYYRMLHYLTLVYTGYWSLKMKRLKNKYMNWLRRGSSIPTLYHVNHPLYLFQRKMAHAVCARIIEI